MQIDPGQSDCCPECDAEFADPALIQRHFFETHLVVASDTADDAEEALRETSMER